MANARPSAVSTMELAFAVLALVVMVMPRMVYMSYPIGITESPELLL